MNQFQCTICNNIQQTNDQCQCCGNTVFDEYNQATTLNNQTQISQVSELKQMKQVVIIGGGIASISVIRNIIKTSDNYSITLITKESRLPYYRTAIPKIIHNPSFEYQKQFTIEQQAFFDLHNISLKLETEVVDIDITKKIVYCQSNDTLFTHSYDDLVFATGAEPNVPPFIRDSPCDNLIPIHALEDIKQIVKCFESSEIHHVCIIGAGLSGIEIAAELRRKYSSLAITLIEVCNRILPRQLTEQASDVFTAVLKDHSIQLFTSCSVNAIDYDEHRRLKIVTNSGELNCDIVCYSCGVHSNTKLAQQIGCSCSRGIVVDDQMKTSLPSIYACGDCCEHNGCCYGNWTDAMKQGEICAESILGNDKVFVHNPLPYFVFCFIGVYSVGSLTEKYILKQTSDQFMQLFYDESGSILVGGILIGKIVSKVQRDLVRAINQKITGEELEQLLQQWGNYF